MSEVNERLAVLETKQDAHASQIAEHDRRLAAIDSWKNWILGVGAAVSFLFGMFADRIKSLVWPQ